jgi:ribosomal RNA-processing protein 8
MFIGEKKRKPSGKSKNITEKKLGRWVSDQQKYYKKKVRLYEDETIYNQWTAFLEKYHEYMKSRTDNWNELFESLKIFIKKNNKHPSQISIDSFEKRLGQWLSQQNDKYKKKTSGMKDNIRYNQWTAFLKEYAQNMSSNKTTDPSETASITISDTVVNIKKKSMKLKSPTIPKETTEQKRQRTKSELSTLHQRYKTLSSQNLRAEFTADPELWHKYHEISQANEQSFPEDEIPRNRIIQELNKIKTKRTKRVVDMGCGKAEIAQYFATDSRFQFINYDHISSNDTVESCDIANTPLEDDSVEICILSLAMWGSNCREYIQEANRILESGGKLYIIEPTKRWSEKDENGNMIPEKESMKLQELLEENGLKIVDRYVAKFCLLVGIKV